MHTEGDVSAMPLLKLVVKGCQALPLSRIQRESPSFGTLAARVNYTTILRWQFSSGGVIFLPKSVLNTPFNTKMCSCKPCKTYVFDLPQIVQLNYSIAENSGSSFMQYNPRL